MGGTNTIAGRYTIINENKTVDVITSLTETSVAVRAAYVVKMDKTKVRRKMKMNLMFVNVDFVSYSKTLLNWSVVSIGIF
ncbi:MAG: hypothetical protein AB7V07_08675 [Candidatus Delongbacteria bacterium]